MSRAKAYGIHVRSITYNRAIRIWLTLSHTITTFHNQFFGSLLKTLWEKEKMLVTSIFSFSHNVFKPVIDKNRHFNPFQNKPWLLRVCSTSLLKTLWEKEKLLKKCNFSFSRSVFYLSVELSAIFIKFEIVVCKLFQFGRV